MYNAFIMAIVYGHTNIICEDYQKVAEFYQEVFECKLVPPKRDQSGEWLEKGTAVRNAHLQGVHLRLPGHGENGPTLEIYQYEEMLEKPLPAAANRKGFGHIAFQVDDFDQVLKNILKYGGKKHGEIVEKKVEGLGVITFTYALDPEDNIIELQKWDYDKVTD